MFRSSFRPVQAAEARHSAPACPFSASAEFNDFLKRTFVDAKLADAVNLDCSRARRTRWSCSHDTIFFMCHDQYLLGQIVRTPRIALMVR
jgi:hypothetical protein